MVTINMLNALEDKMRGTLDFIPKRCVSASTGL